MRQQVGQGDPFQTGAARQAYFDAATHGESPEAAPSRRSSPMSPQPQGQSLRFLDPPASGHGPPNRMGLFLGRARLRAPELVMRTSPSTAAALQRCSSLSAATSARAPTPLEQHPARAVQASDEWRMSMSGLRSSALSPKTTPRAAARKSYRHASPTACRWPCRSTRGAAIHRAAPGPLGRARSGSTSGRSSRCPVTIRAPPRLACSGLAVAKTRWSLPRPGKVDVRRTRRFPARAIGRAVVPDPRCP